MLYYIDVSISCTSKADKNLLTSKSSSSLPSKSFGYFLSVILTKRLHFSSSNTNSNSRKQLYRAHHTRFLDGYARERNGNQKRSNFTF